MGRLGWGLGIGLAGLWLAGPVEAVRPGASKGIAETTCSTQTRSGERAVVKSVRGGYVHALSLVCPTAPCEVALYDSASSTLSDGTVRWEGRVASNHGTYSEAFQTPLVFDDGVAYEVNANASVCIAWE